MLHTASQALYDSEKEKKCAKKALTSDTGCHKRAVGCARGLSAAQVKQLSFPPALPACGCPEAVPPAEGKQARGSQGTRVGTKSRDPGTEPAQRHRDGQDSKAGRGWRGAGAGARPAARQGRAPQTGLGRRGGSSRAPAPVAEAEESEGRDGSSRGRQAEAAREREASGGPYRLAAVPAAPPTQARTAPQLNPSDGGRREPKLPRPRSAARDPAPRCRRESAPPALLRSRCRGEGPGPGSVLAPAPRGSLCPWGLGRCCPSGEPRKRGCGAAFSLSWPRARCLLRSHSKTTRSRSSSQGSARRSQAKGLLSTLLFLRYLNFLHPLVQNGSRCWPRTPQLQPGRLCSPEVSPSEGLCHSYRSRLPWEGT